ncbi:MAG: hypothetical protein ACK5N8_08755 [Alphaproteobacteria bacterium]
MTFCWRSIPGNAQEINYRLRGAGAYRHLRMDQGPGGNFTRFDLGNDDRLKYNLQKDKGFALPEQILSEQFDRLQDSELNSFVEEIQKAFEKNDYNKTAILTNKFRTLAEAKGVAFHNGENVGSKSGFFFIRPTGADKNVEFPITKIPELRAKIDEALNKSLSLAEYARGHIRDGKSYEEAIIRAEKDFHQKGNVDYKEKGLLYFQPDCFVDNKGNVEIEKINMPDVGMFMTMLNRPSNQHIQKVIESNFELKDKIKKSAETYLNKDDVVLMTREEVVDYKSDSLEILEIKALKKMLESIGKNVSIKTLRDYETINKNQEVLLLNVDIANVNYGKFTEHMIRNEIDCYSDPLVYRFKDKATTLKTLEVPSQHMENFLNIIKPKDINAKNAENTFSRLQNMMGKMDMREDILYANVTGYKTPVPVFKYSLHSFAQVYNAYEKSQAEDKKISFSSVPLNEANAVFYKDEKPRMSAFRFMCTKGEGR